MNNIEFLELMGFPKEWNEWEMYPEELSKIQISCYEAGDEESPEHTRNGAFHWWLKNNPTNDTLSKLLELSYLDPESHMGDDIRRYIRKANNYSPDIEK